MGRGISAPNPLTPLATRAKSNRWSDHSYSLTQTNPSPIHVMQTNDQWNMEVVIIKWAWGMGQRIVLKTRGDSVKKEGIDSIKRGYGGTRVGKGNWEWDTVLTNSSHP